MRRLLGLLAAPLVATLSLSSPDIWAETEPANYAVTGSLGTTGIGLEWIKPLNEKLEVRLIAQYGWYDFDYDDTDIEYDAEYEAANFGALIDWRPFGGAFRVSGGLVATNFGLDLEANTNGGTFDLGDNEYFGDVTFEGEADFADVAPYLAIGWSSNPRHSGMYYGGELGIMYMGSVNLSYGADGCVKVAEFGGTCVPVGRLPQFQDDLEQERQDLEDDLDDYKFWPILSISIGYRF